MCVQETEGPGVCVCVYEDKGCVCEKETEGPGVRVCVYDDRGASAQAHVLTHMYINACMHSQTNTKHNAAYTHAHAHALKRVCI